MDWISVKDRLPEEHQRVIVARRDGFVEPGERFDGVWFPDLGPEWEDGVVTHWMPLPQPPKEVSDGR